MRFILLEKLRQEITQKRNQLLLLLSSFPNYYKPFRGFEDLMSMVFNIFWSLVLLLSNFVFFFSSLIEDLQFDFNLITNIFLDSVLFLGTHLTHGLINRPCFLTPASLSDLLEQSIYI